MWFPSFPVDSQWFHFSLWWDGKCSRSKCHSRCRWQAGYCRVKAQNIWVWISQQPPILGHLSPRLSLHPGFPVGRMGRLSPRLLRRDSKGCLWNGHREAARPVDTGSSLRNGVWGHAWTWSQLGTASNTFFTQGFILVNSITTTGSIFSGKLWGLHTEAKN